MDIETILCMGEDELIKKWLNRDFKGNMGSYLTLYMMVSILILFMTLFIIILRIWIMV